MSNLQEKELKKWSTGRRKKIFKNRLKTKVSHVVDKCLAQDDERPEDANLLKKDMMDIMLNTITSKEFKESLSRDS